MIPNYCERKLLDWGTQSHPQLLHNTETTPQVTTRRTLLGPQVFNNPFFTQADNELFNLPLSISRLGFFFLYKKILSFEKPRSGSKSKGYNNLGTKFESYYLRLFLPLKFCVISVIKGEQRNKAISNNMNLENMVKNKSNHPGFFKLLITKIFHWLR